MAFRHGKDTGVAVESANLTSYFASADSNHDVETADSTTFGNNSRTYVVGQRDGTISLSGMFDGDANAVDEELQALLGVEDGAHVLIQRGGAAADGPGLSVTFGLCEATSYSVDSPVDDIVSITFDAQADGGLFTGVALQDPDGGALGDSFTAGASTDVASVDNSASTANGYVAQLHVVANSLDGDLIVTIEDSANDSTFATLDTFTTVGAGTTTAEQITGTGTVERYVRINIDTLAATTGSASVVVGFARLPATS